ncbi:MAG: winged helix-turn-helix domain-containing protein [Acidobacteria bacterium]|nr:winged helix-turn-helix domain-containing protein [Acidobacteriota bacterium]
MRYRFGLFEFDRQSMDLRRLGAPVHLQSQPKQVLGRLLQNAGTVVSRDELRKAVWGETTFVDFERGLNFCISQVRTALGDDASSPAYVRTVARQGYEFIAPVKVVEPAAATLQPPSRRAVFQEWARSWPSRCGWLPAAALILLAGIIASYSLHLRRAGRRVPVVAVVRFDNETGDAAMTRFADQLTDVFVERLTALSSDRYAVVGNAHILRLPREQRDLNAIASSVGAGYVVLGQVQAAGEKTRILIHLIRMPGQTHVGVARIERDLGNPLDLEAEVASKVTADFSQRLLSPAPLPALPPAAAH